MHLTSKTSQIERLIKVQPISLERKRIVTQPLAYVKNNIIDINFTHMISNDFPFVDNSYNILTGINLKDVRENSPNITSELENELIRLDPTTSNRFKEFYLMNVNLDISVHFDYFPEVLNLDTVGNNTDKRWYQEQVKKKLIRKDGSPIFDAKAAIIGNPLRFHKLLEENNNSSFYEKGDNYLANLVTGVVLLR